MIDFEYVSHHDMSFESSPQGHREESVPSIPMSAFVDLPQEEQHELTSKTFENLATTLADHGFIASEDITEMYTSLPQETMIVRRENPDAIQELFSKGSYTINFVGGDEYANCVAWKPADGSINLQNAYLEGFGQKNAIVAIVGLRPSKTLEMKKLDDSTQDYFGLDRRGVRSTQGTVAPSNLVFVTLRAPLTHLTDEKLTEDELERKYEYLELVKSGKHPEPIFVHRGFMRDTHVQ